MRTRRSILATAIAVTVAVGIAAPVAAALGAPRRSSGAVAAAVGEPRGHPGESALHQRITVRDLPPATPSEQPPLEPNEADDLEPGTAEPTPNTVEVGSRLVPNEGDIGLRGTAPLAPLAPTAVDPTAQQVSEFAAIEYDGPSPPDTVMAVGPTRIIEMVNATGAIYTKTGTQTSTFNLTDFFGAPTIPMVSPQYGDPKLLYDARSGRFFAENFIVDGCKPSMTCTTSNNTEVDLAVSDTSNPAGAWTVYVIDTSANNQILDQPKIGVSDDKIVMTINRNGFGGPYLFIVLEKADLLAAASSVRNFFFNPDTTHYNLIPVHSMSATNTEYAVSAKGGSSTLSVFAFTGTPAANNVASTTSDLTIGTLNEPPNAEQSSDSRGLDMGPAGMHTAVWDGDVLWAGGMDKCTPSGDSAGRACLRLIEVSTAGSPSLTRDFDLGQVGGHLSHPGVMLDVHGNLYVGHSVFSSSTFPTAGESFVPAGSSSTTVAGIDYRAGSGPYNCTFCKDDKGNLTRNRWGDYSAAGRDPAAPGNVCVAEEYGSTSTTNTDLWGTAIACFTANAATAVDVSSSVNPSTVGQPVTFTAVVCPSGTPPPQAPSGTVAFSIDGGPALSTANLSTSGAPVGCAKATSSAISSLTVGTHTVDAAYAGDANYQPGAGGLAGGQVVTKAGTQTALASSANPSVFGQLVTFTATVTVLAPGTGTPTGTVTFRDGATVLGTSGLGGGTTSLGVSTLAVGSHTITAEYSGSSSFLGSTGSLTQVVNKAPTATAISSSTNPSFFGDPVTFTATVTVPPPGAGTPTGSVAFTDGATPLGTVPLGLGGIATFTTAGLQVGTHSIVATYSGDGNFLASSSAPLAQEVRCNTVITGTHAGFIVKKGSVCLVDANITGAVQVQPGAALSVTRSTLKGPLAGSGATAITVCDSKLPSLLVTGTTGFVLIGDHGDDGYGCAGNTISGSVGLHGNAGQLELGDNQVKGSVLVTGTSGVGPSVEDAVAELEANQIKGTLSCSGNVPDPTNGGAPNTVGGARGGQCKAPGF